jgi:hypothetical protein
MASTKTKKPAIVATKPKAKPKTKAKPNAKPKTGGWGEWSWRRTFYKTT